MLARELAMLLHASVLSQPCSQSVPGQSARAKRPKLAPESPPAHCGKESAEAKDKSMTWQGKHELDETMHGLGMAPPIASSRAVVTLAFLVAIGSRLGGGKDSAELADCAPAQVDQSNA